MHCFKKLGRYFKASASLPWNLLWHRDASTEPKPRTKAIGLKRRKDSPSDHCIRLYLGTWATWLCIALILHMDHCRNDFLKSPKPSIGNYSQCWIRASRNTNLPQSKPRAIAAEGNESPQENSLHLPTLPCHLVHITYSFYFSASPADHLCIVWAHWDIGTTSKKSELLEILGWNRIN